MGMNVYLNIFPPTGRWSSCLLSFCFISGFTHRTLKTASLPGRFQTEWIGQL